MRCLYKRYLCVSAIAATATLLAVSTIAGAEHFNITLTASGDGNTLSATTDTTPPIGGVNPRRVLKVRHGSDIKITWKMASGFPHGTMKNVTVHFFIVKEAEIGQKPVPDPSGAGGIVDNRLTLDYNPKSETSGSIKVRIPDPGNYLVRLQSEDTHVEHDHEHFSALDLVVQ